MSNKLLSPSITLLYSSAMNGTSLKKIDHLGIAVRSIENTLPYYEKALGLKCERIEEVPSQKVRTAFISIGEVHLELLEPTSEDSTIAKFINERGEGIHHIAFYSTNIEGQLAQAKENGVRLIHEVPFEGANNKLVAFLHPKSTFGVLTEFCTAKDPSHAH
ncbi:MAG: methylmalonyl-CoA epimerase [Chthoniobacterales bacterium]|nr:methylmalonyl-CoA epimerase [Chthoniobacterales bacterium]